MNLESLLSQLKRIEPREEYAAHSRTEILSRERSVKKRVWYFFLQGLHAGSAIVLAGILFVLVFGGFSLIRYITPFRISSLDPATIRAEAKAIDIQIQLADLNYQEPSHVQIVQTTQRVFATPDAQLAEIKKEAEAQAKTLGLPAGTVTSTASSTESFSIDQALQKLSE